MIGGKVLDLPTLAERVFGAADRIGETAQEQSDHLETLERWTDQARQRRDQYLESALTDELIAASLSLGFRIWRADILSTSMGVICCIDTQEMFAPWPVIEELKRYAEAHFNREAPTE